MATLELSIAELECLFRRKNKRKPGVEKRSTNVPEMLMTKSAYEHGMHELGRREPEFGGLLIGSKNHPLVIQFVPDTTGLSTPGTFTWGHDNLNALLRQYGLLGFDCRGFWHSHPEGFRHLSDGDLAFVRKVFGAPGNDIDEVLMPIFVDGRCIPFIVYPGQSLKVVEAKLVLI